jgi:monovalent cation/hydrogen antiporter
VDVDRQRGGAARAHAHRLGRARWGSLVFGLSVLAVVIVVRIAWLVVYRAIVAAIRRWHLGLADRLASRDPRGAIVLGWSGMRGLITLATAFALPQQFPGRDLIVLCVFCVVLGTLVIQGFTLPPLMRLLRFEDEVPSNVNCPTRASPSCRRRSTASTARHHPTR